MDMFEHRGVVRWAETDASGLFHYSSALIWAEEAEHALCRALDPAWTPHAMPRKAVSASYHAPFRAGDAYVVRLWVEKIGTTSIGFAWRVMNGETLAAEGKHTAVRLGDDARPQPLAPALKEGLVRHLKGSDDV